MAIIGLVGVIPNEWVEANSSVKQIGAQIFSMRQGERIQESIWNVDPEDYAEIGGLMGSLDMGEKCFFS